MLNTITRGFSRDRETNSVGRRYVRQTMNIEELSNTEGEPDTKTPEVEVTFFEKDATDIHPQNDYYCQVR